MKIILRQVYIYKGQDLLYYMHFGKALKQDIFSKLVKELMADISAKKSIQTIESHDYYKYRISYTTDKENDLLFLFVTGLTDSSESIKKELIKCKKEFLNLFSDILQHKFDAKTFEVFDPTIDSIHRNLRPKISLVGFSGVGKTTITKLIKAEEIPMKHVPTITGDIATIKIGKLYFHLWDFAGQEQFSYLWNNFVKGSDAVLLITDSTLENVEKSKFFLELIKEGAPYAHTAVIGNKQDLPDALKPIQIEKIVGIKTYSMIAKDDKNRDKMIQIIADILEMSAEISPLLKPLLERDKLTEEAMNALENAEFSEAAILFEKISDLCIELGDDSLGREFYEKTEKIRQMLKQVEAPQQPPEISDLKKESPKPVEEVSVAPPEKPTVKPVEEVSVAPPEKPTIKPVEEVSVAPPEKPTVKPAEEVSVAPPEKPTVKPVEEVSIAPPKKPTIELVKEISIATPKKAEVIPFSQIQANDVKNLELDSIEPREKELKKKKKEKKSKKKKKKKKKKKDFKELETREVKSIIEQPSFLKKAQVPKVEIKSNEIETIQATKYEEVAKKSESLPDSDMPWLHPKLKKIQEQKKVDEIVEAIKTEEEEKDILFKPKLGKDKAGIQINPEDFMIRQRPKQVLSVPEDAKTKLKTSAFGHVENISEKKTESPVSPTELAQIANDISKPVAPTKLIKPAEEVPKPVAPTKLIKPAEEIPKPVAPTKLIKPAEEVPKELTYPKESETTITKTLEKPTVPPKPIEKPQKAEKTEIIEQRKNLEDTLIDLKIKKAKLQKMAIDFDMQELSGEITSEELKEKKEKLKSLEKKIEVQIVQTEKYLKDIDS